jgi:transcriptional regulator with PAS, ATPase and Fis domain
VQSSENPAFINMEKNRLPSQPDHSDMLRQLMDHISDNIYFMERQGRIVLISQWGGEMARL